MITPEPRHPLAGFRPATAILLLEIPLAALMMGPNSIGPPIVFTLAVGFLGTICAIHAVGRSIVQATLDGPAATAQAMRSAVRSKAS